MPRSSLIWRGWWWWWWWWWWCRLFVLAHWLIYVKSDYCFKEWICQFEMGELKTRDKYVFFGSFNLWLIYHSSKMSIYISFVLQNIDWIIEQNVHFIIDSKFTRNWKWGLRLKIRSCFFENGQNWKCDSRLSLGNVMVNNETDHKSDYLYSAKF